MLFAFTNESMGEVTSAEMLETLCNYKSLPQEHKKFAKHSCYSIIRAYLEYNSAMKTHYKLMVPFCLADGGSTLEGAAATFLGYLQQNPQYKPRTAVVVFADAMALISKCE